MQTNYIENGDCLKLIKSLDNKSIDVSFTSPPYNRIRNDTYQFYDDTKKDYFDFLINITNEMLRVTKDYVIVNIQCNHFNKSDFYKYIGYYSDLINGIIVWEKTNPQPANNYDKEHNTRSVTNSFEYFIFIKDGGNFVAYGKKQFKNIIKSTVNSNHFKGHGAVMKEEIADLIINNFTKKGDIILDPFMGCGTTAVSCIKSDRKYIGYEIVPQYLKIAQDRINSLHNQINIFDFLQNEEKTNN